MAKTYKFILIFFIGLVFSQLISTFFVYLSNYNYYRSLSLICGLGYLAVPNQRVFASLKNFWPAFNGGVFFTFTNGAFLTFAGFSAAFVWKRLMDSKKNGLAVIVVFWLFLVFYANSKGFSPFISCLLVFVPCLVFMITQKLIPGASNHPPVKRRIMALTMSFVVFALILGTRVNINLFLDIRDNLLMTSRIGLKLNEFYYKNSLYSARAFKSLSQRLLRTCKLEMSNDEARGKLASRLIANDYLPVEGHIQADLVIKESGKDLFLMAGPSLVVKTKIKKFYQSTSKILKEFEKKTDSLSFFRFFTMFSMVFMGGVLIYSGFFLIVFLASRSFTPNGRPFLTACLLCVLAAAVIAVLYNPRGRVKLPDLKSSMISGSRRENLAVLRYICSKRLRLGHDLFSMNYLQSDDIALRYWFAKALGFSRGPEVRQALNKLLYDKQFNVVCMALYSMGEQRSKHDIPLIIKKIRGSNNWYEQWYAYKALRKIGWKQGRLGYTGSCGGNSSGD